jgi:hypothetical protein
MSLTENGLELLADRPELDSCCATIFLSIPVPPPCNTNDGSCGDGNSSDECLVRYETTVDIVGLAFGFS